MSEAQVTDAGSTGSEQAPISVHKAGGDGPLSVREATNSLVDFRRKRDASQEQPQATEQAPETPATELADEANAAAASEQPPGETEVQAEPEAELPPIEPPRSWTKDEKERFQSLPRETQEYLANREQERDREIRRSQNESAEQRKILEKEKSTVAEARARYEQALPALLETLQQQQAGEFADVKTIADVERLAREDWPRYVLWDAQQKKIAAVQYEVTKAQERQNQEYSEKWNEFAKREDGLFSEKAPEMKDKALAEKLMRGAVETLKELGFTDKELQDGYQGRSGLSLRDHRLQLLVRDAVRFRDAQAKAKAAVVVPKPQVQRPGAAQPKGAQHEAEVQALTQRLNTSGSLKDAVALRRAQRAASR